MDGELSEAESTALAEFLSAHPELNADVEAFTQIQFAPDTNVIFENKAALLQKETKVIGFFPRYRKVLAFAAVLLLVVAVVGVWYSNQNVFEQQVVSNQPKGNEVAPAQKLPSQPVTTEASNKVDTAQKVAIAATQEASVGAGKQRQSLIVKGKATPIAESVSERKEGVPVVAQAVILEKVPTAKLVELPVAVKGITRTKVTDLPVVDIEKTQTESWTSALEGDDGKKAKLVALSKSINNGVTRIQELKESLHGQSVTFGVKDKKVKIIF